MFSHLVFQTTQEHQMAVTQSDIIRFRFRFYSHRKERENVEYLSSSRVFFVVDERFVNGRETQQKKPKFYIKLKSN